MRLLADFELFVEVGNMGHFGRAAAALDMPASTLSRRIAALEKELGVSLINRSTRSFSLTEAGQACYERARKLIAEATRMREELGADADHLSGHLRIGFPTDLALTIFSAELAAFSRANSEISIEVIAIEGHPNLLKKGLDVGFMVSHQLTLPDSAFTSRRIGTFSRMLFASKTYLKLKGTLSDPSELETHSCIRFSHGRLEKQWELHRGKEKRTVAVEGDCSANCVGLAAQFAREHLGLSCCRNFSPHTLLLGRA